MHPTLLLCPGANSMDERTMDGQTMKNNERAKNPATTKQVAVTTATLIKQASYIMGWREIHAGAPNSLPPALGAQTCHATHLPARAAALRHIRMFPPWRKALLSLTRQGLRASEASGACARHIRPRLCRASVTTVAFLYGLV